MAEKAGRGLLYLTVSNILFIASGSLVLLALARLLGLEEFGVYGIVVSLVSTVDIVFVNGFKQAVSKFVAEEHGILPEERRQMLKAVLAIGVLLFVVFFAGAGFFAMLLNDPSLTVFLQIVSLLMLTYALHSFFMGYFNGLRLFGFEALLRIVYAVLKLALIVGLAALTLNVLYAFSGLVAASVAVVLCGTVLYSRVNAGPAVRVSAAKYSHKKFLRFAASVMAFALFTTFLANLDLFMVKSVSPPGEANALSGYYAAASTVSRVTYYAVFALTAVVLPVVSSLSFRKKSEEIKAHILKVNRYTLLFLGFAVALVSATAAPLVALLFGAKFLPAAEPLRVLSFGLGFFSFFTVIASIITGHGKPNIALGAAAAALAIDFVLNALFIPVFGLSGAAWASTAAMFFAFICVSVYLVSRFGVFCSPKSVVRVVFASGAVFFFSAAMPFSGLLLAVTYLAAILVYAGILFLTGELKKGDIVFLRRAFL